MWGFGLYLMRLADYLAGRSHQKRERTSKTDRHLTDTKECQICGKDFLGGGASFSCPGWDLIWLQYSEFVIASLQTGQFA